MPSKEEIEAGRTPAGGFTKAQLAEWGVPWPPPKGWRRKLLDEWRGKPTHWWDAGFTGVHVARTIGELAGLPLGTRIATNHNRLLILGEFAGSEHWYEDGELTNYQPLVHWLPAVILPPVREMEG